MLDKVKLRKAYAILVSALCVIAALALILGCVSIYNSGPRPFTRESIAETFSRIAFPVWLFIIAALLAVVVEIFIPDEEKKKKDVQYGMMLSALRRRRPDSTISEDVLKLVNAEREKRKKLFIIGICISVACSVYPLIYALNKSNFRAENVNLEITVAMITLIAFFIPPFAYVAIAGAHFKKSVIREIELIRADKPEGKTEPIPKNAPLLDSPKIKLAVRISCLCISALFIVLGIINGGMDDVLQKAVRICTECIGLG